MGNITRTVINQRKCFLPHLRDKMTLQLHINVRMSIQKST